MWATNSGLLLHVNFRLHRQKVIILCFVLWLPTVKACRWIKMAFAYLMHFPLSCGIPSAKFGVILGQKFCSLSFSFQFLARDAFVERIVALLPWCSSVRLSVRPSILLSGTGVHCDHTVHYTADLSLRLDSPVFWTPCYQSMSTYSQPSFSNSTGNRWGMDVQTRPIAMYLSFTYALCVLMNEWMNECCIPCGVIKNWGKGVYRSSSRIVDFDTSFEPLFWCFSYLCSPPV